MARHWTPIYRVIAAANIIAVLVLVAYKVGYAEWYLEYTHRVVSYEHGFVRRGLVGAVYALVTPVVPLWAFRVEALLTCGVAWWLGWVLFRRWVHLKGTERLAFMCFVFGSPLLFKNFTGNFGKFDVLGAMVAMLACMMPLRFWTFVVVGILSAVTLLVHHVNATLFVPTVYGVLLLRGVAASPLTTRRVAGGVALSLAALSAEFAALSVMGDASLSPELFLAFLRSRSAIPLPDYVAFPWVTNYAQEVGRTAARMERHVLYLPIYVAVAALHRPLIGFARRRLADIAGAERTGGRAFRAVTATVLAGYAATVFVTFDHARYFADLAFCLVLLCGAQIVAHQGPIADAADMDLRRPGVVGAAAVLAVIAWFGTVTPLL